jgi:F0F1-type ATP synthase delta subunit
MSKTFNSKNLSKQIEQLISLGKVSLAIDILKAKELSRLLPNILNTLKKKNEKKKDFEQTKIYSKTDLDKSVLEKLEKNLSIDIKSSKLIIDETMSAGVKIKAGDKLVDATLETMLENAIEDIISKK